MRNRRRAILSVIASPPLSNDVVRTVSRLSAHRLCVCYCLCLISDRTCLGRYSGPDLGQIVACSASSRKNTSPPGTHSARRPAARRPTSRTRDLLPCGVPPLLDERYA